MFFIAAYFAACSRQGARHMSGTCRRDFGSDENLSRILAISSFNIINLWLKL